MSVFCGYRRKLQTPSLPVFTQAASAIALLSFAVAWFAHFYVALGATTRDSNVIIPVETVTPPCQRTEATMERGGREVNLVQGVDLLGIGGQQAGRVSGASRTPVSLGIWGHRLLGRRLRGVAKRQHRADAQMSRKRTCCGAAGLRGWPSGRLGLRGYRSCGWREPVGSPTIPRNRR